MSNSLHEQIISCFEQKQNRLGIELLKQLIKTHNVADINALILMIMNMDMDAKIMDTILSDDEIRAYSGFKDTVFIFVSVVNGNAKMTRIMLQHGLPFDNTFIIFSPNLEFIKVLWEFGASLKTRGIPGNLIHAHITNSEVVKWLLENRVPIEPDNEGIWPHEKTKDPEVLQLLSQPITELAPLNPREYMGNKQETLILTTTCKCLLYLEMEEKINRVPPEIIHQIMWFI